jgi:hypothetical protein
MRALTEKQRQALTELASGDQPTLYHKQYGRTSAALVSRGLVERNDAGHYVLTASGRDASQPKTSGRKRIYSDEADRQAAYRRRKEKAEFMHRHELERIKAAAIAVLKNQGQYIEAEGTQGIINGLYRLDRATEGTGAADRADFFPNF